MRTLNARSLSVSVVLLLSTYIAAQNSGRPLQIYSIDVEGGQATLLVSPSGQSMLVDTGWPGFNGRDADRIVSAARSAGLHQIEYVVITHYHVDHVGGVAQLADRINAIGKLGNSSDVVHVVVRDYHVLDLVKPCGPCR